MVTTLRLLWVRILLVALAFVCPIATEAYLQLGELNHAAAVIGIERSGVVCLTRAYAILDVLDMPAEMAHRGTADVSAAFHDLAASGCPEKAAFARLARRDVRDSSARLQLAVAIDGKINDIGEQYLWYDSSPVTAHASDSSAYALADALPELAFAAATTDRIAAAKFAARATSRLAIVDYDVAALIKAAPWTASELRGPHARQKAYLDTYFRMLDQWERQPAAPHPDFSVPLRAAFRGSDQVLAGFTHILDRNLLRERDQLDHRRAMVIASSWLILAVALAVAGYIARGVMRRQRREIARLRDVALKEARFQAIFAGSPLAIAITDLTGTVLESNDAYAELVGASSLQGVQTPIFHGVVPDRPSDIASLFGPALENATPSAPVEITLARDGASPVVCDATATLVRTPGDDVVYCAVMLQDITERQLREHRLQYEATHDGLTGIANRSALLDVLQERLARQPEGTPRFALLFLDVDDFKSVNDTLGHVAGDGCLVAIAERLQSLVRHDDTVARFGGDEFAILFCDAQSIEQVDDIVWRLRREINLPIELGDFVLSISCSIGVAIDGGGDDAQVAFACADGAMYVDKARAPSRAASIRQRTA